jgi:hypothetical protein
MLETLPVLHGTSRAEASLFEINASALSLISETIGDLFLAYHKTRAHFAEAERDSLFPVHESVLPSVQ